jgi:hypothetical protein
MTLANNNKQQQLLTRVLIFSPGRASAARACALLPQPPEEKAVTAAAEVLVAIGALEKHGEGEKLTNLGSLLARLPIDVRLAKLCVLGVCFRGALDDALTVRQQGPLLLICLLFELLFRKKVPNPDFSLLLLIKIFFFFFFFFF